MPKYTFNGRTYVLEASAVAQAGGVEGYFARQNAADQARIARSTEQSLTIKRLTSQGEAYKAYGYSSQAELDYWASATPNPQPIYQWVDSQTGRLINTDTRGMPACFNPLKNAIAVPTGRVSYSSYDINAITAKAAATELATYTGTVTQPSLSTSQTSLVVPSTNRPVQPKQFTPSTPLNFESGNTYSLAKLSDAVEGGKASFRIQRTGDITVAGSVNFATRNGTALAGADYTAVNETISFAAGESSKIIEVATTTDGLAENQDSFHGIITTTRQGDSVSMNAASVSIYSQQYSLAKLADAVEGGNATFRVTRSGDTSVSSTVLFSTANGSAIGGLDFTPVNQQIIFAAGESTKDINVLALRDSVAESSESFTASLSRVDNDSIISGGSIAATITNGAGTSSYSLAKLSDAVEGGKASFRIQRTGDITVAGSVNFATRNGTALAGADYTAVNETISFAAGESSSSVDIQTLSDSSSELTETFAGAISIISPGDTIANGLASASIIESIVAPSSSL
jgi:hypothetical protein